MHSAITVTSMAISRQLHTVSVLGNIRSFSSPSFVRNDVAGEFDSNLSPSTTSSNNTTIVVKKLPQRLLESPEILRTEFANFGTVFHVEIFRHGRSGSPRGFAFITFESHTAMNAALTEMNGKEMDGKVIEASILKQRDESQYPNPPSRKLFVDNLMGLHSRVVLEAFEKYGPVKVKRTKERFAHLVFDDVRTATEALEMHMGRVGSNVVKVSYAQKFNSQPPRTKKVDGWTGSEAEDGA